MSEVMKALLGTIADHPQLFLITLGFLTILIGWTFGASWIIALGFLLLLFGVITEKGRGEWKQSPVH